MLEIRPIGTANLPDAARLCLAGKSLTDRPRAFTKDIEHDCTRDKLSFLHACLSSGAKAFAAYRAGMLVGYVEAHPIDQALQPVDGEDCFVIVCMRVPEEVERPEVEPALIDHLANEMGPSRGIAVYAREKDWAALGFEELDRHASEIQGEERVLWFRRTGEGDAPTMVEPDRDIPSIRDKTRVDLFFNERCPWDAYVFGLVRGVCAVMKEQVILLETDCSNRRDMLRVGVANGIAINGRFQPWLRPYRLPGEHEIRRAIEDAT